MALPTDSASHAPAAMAPGVTRGSESVGRRAAGGAVWVFLAFAAGRALSFGASLVLARLLVPADFGLVSFAMIVIGIFTLLQDLGVPQALIYSRREPAEAGGTALTINLAAAGLLAALACALAPLLARMGNDDQIRDLVWVLSIGLVITAAGSVQSASLQRDLAFRRKFVTDVVAVLAEGAVAISLALLGFGVWSLVIAYLVRTTTATVALWRLSPLRPRLRFNAAIARELIGYGKHVSLNSVFGFALNNVDFLIVGTFLGATTLGIYTLAYTVASLPTTAIGQVVTTAMFPAYTRLRDDRAQLLALFERVFLLVWTLAFVTGIGIVVAGPTWLSHLLGERWESIGEPLRVLALASALRAAGTVFPPAYRALGRPNVEWRFTLLRLTSVVPLMLLSIWLGWGVVGVGLAQIAVSLVYLPSNASVFARLSGFPLRRLATLFGAQLVACAVALTVWLALRLPASIDQDALSISLLTALLASGCYAAVVLALDRELARSAVVVVRGMARNPR